MGTEDPNETQFARTASLESIPALLTSDRGDTLEALIENPFLDEPHLCQLLERKDLPGTLLAEIAKRKKWQASYRVRRALAAHPHTPRLIAIRMLRDLYLMDLVRICQLPSSKGELRRLAEDRVLTQLPQVSLGQKLMLARRGSSRVAGGLIVQGPIQVVNAALENVFLTETHLLSTLTKESLPARTVAAVANHGKWSKLVNIRMALLRHPHAPAECINMFVPDLTQREIEDLLGHSQLLESVRVRLLQEIEQRKK